MKSNEAYQYYSKARVVRWNGELSVSFGILWRERSRVSCIKYASMPEADNK